MTIPLTPPATLLKDTQSYVRGAVSSRSTADAADGFSAGRSRRPARSPGRPSPCDWSIAYGHPRIVGSCRGHGNTGDHMHWAGHTRRALGLAAVTALAVGFGALGP